MSGKRLYLLRHAKSSWSDQALADFDRPLNRRGREAATRLGAFVAHSGITPDIILCSPAQRTRETLAAILAATGWQVPVHEEVPLYGADLERLLARLSDLPDDVTSALLVGHNPGLQDLAVWLAQKGPVAARDRMAAKYPTGGFAEIHLTGETWADALMQGGELVHFRVPRDKAGGT